jgi:hypothetical protein
MPGVEAGRTLERVLLQQNETSERYTAPVETYVIKCLQHIRFEGTIVGLLIGLRIDGDGCAFRVRWRKSCVDSFGSYCSPAGRTMSRPPLLLAVVYQSDSGTSNKAEIALELSRVARVDPDA